MSCRSFRGRKKISRGKQRTPGFLFSRCTKVDHACLSCFTSFGASACRNERCNAPLYSAIFFSPDALISESRVSRHFSEKPFSQSGGNALAAKEYTGIREHIRRKNRDKVRKARHRANETAKVSQNGGIRPGFEPPPFLPRPEAWDPGRWRFSKLRTVNCDTRTGGVGPRSQISMRKALAVAIRFERYDRQREEKKGDRREEMVGESHLIPSDRRGRLRVRGV